MLPLSFGAKTNIVIALAMITLAAVDYLSFRETSQLINREAQVSHSREVLEADASLSLHVSQAISARRGYLITGHDGEIGLLAQESAAAQAELEKLRALTADNSDQLVRLQALAPLLQKRLALLKQSVELHHQNLDGKDRTAQDAFSKQGGELAEQMSEVQQTFHKTETSLLVQRLLEAAGADRQVLRIERLLVALVFVVLVAGLVFVNHEIVLRTRSERELIDKERLVRSVLNSTGDAILVADRDGNIILRNAVAARYHMNVPPQVAPDKWAELFGVYRADKKTLMPAEELPLARAALRGEEVDNLEVYIRPRGWENGRLHLASSRPLLDGAGRRHGGIVILRDITERKVLEENRDQLIADLHKSLSNIKTLSGLLPICAGCKRVRDDRGYWTQVEDYVAKRSEVTFSHGLCPECVAGLYPEVARKKGPH